jgi:hypothetical protein
MVDIKDMFDSAEVDEEPSETKRRGKDDMDKIPDGSYRATVTDFSVFEDKGTHFVSWWFEVNSGVAAGAQLQNFSSVNPDTVQFIKRAVGRVIGRVPEWTELFDADTGRTGRAKFDIVNKDVQVTQKTVNKKGKTYVNVYVDRLLSVQDKPEPETEAADSSEEVDVDDLF